jgi:hypothetical protein
VTQAQLEALADFNGHRERLVWPMPPQPGGWLVQAVAWGPLLIGLGCVLVALVRK